MELTQSPAKPTDETKKHVQLWQDRIKAGKQHWQSFFDRAEYNRKFVRGLNDKESKSQEYNKHRANLIQSTIATVLSRVYAKNPDIEASTTGKNAALKVFAQTIAKVTSAMLKDGKIKKQGKRMVKASMITGHGIVKVIYQRDIRTDPVIQSRIKDSQDNIARIEALIRDMEDEAQRGDLVRQKLELETAVIGLQAKAEVVAAEGLALDIVRTGRLIIDPAVEDIWDYEDAAYLIECIPMRMSVAKGKFPDCDFESAKTWKAGKFDFEDEKNKEGSDDDPVVMIYEVWSAQDNTVFTLCDGVTDCFAREPYQPENLGERWYPYFLIPFQTVDGCKDAPSLVDLLEKLQAEHNEARDKEHAIRTEYKPHYIASGMTKAEDIEKKAFAGIGEVLVFKNADGRLGDIVQPGQTIQADPNMFNLANVRADMEMVSGLQDAARSTVVDPKTATEASIMEQSLSARVGDFRDQVEDCLSDIAKYSAELCWRNMTEAQVKQIMGDEPMSWPQDQSAEALFSMMQIAIRAGSTGQPNKLQAQDVWIKAMPIIQPIIQQIRMIDAQGGDSTPERELLKETATRFDESLDIERFMPPKPTMQPIPGLPGMPTTGGLPAPLPLQ
jgi:hypothetical protein